eukprot:COSAG02_NODE_39676_length_414_cov_0.796825_1_plen_57_part_00
MPCVCTPGWDGARARATAERRPIIVLRNANEKTFDNKGKKCGNLGNLVYNLSCCSY